MNEKIFWALFSMAAALSAVALHYLGLKHTDIILAGATFIGPIMAVQAQKWLETKRGEEGRREEVFKNLMASRGATTSPMHVQALNSIDLEFHGERFKSVRSAWRIYLDHLGSFPQDESAAETQIKIWNDRNGDLLVDLLKSMADGLGYYFDRVDIKRGVYVPMVHGQDENEARALRRMLLQTFSGDAPLKMNVVGLPTDAEALKQHRKMIENINFLLNSGALPVELKASEKRNSEEKSEFV